MLGLYFRSCVTIWLAIYGVFAVLLGLPAIFLHLMAVGALLSAVAYFRLPPPDAEASHALLGVDPLNLDGTPSRSRTDSELGPIAHRAAGTDAPENTLAAVRACAARGAKCVEFDVSLTSDGMAVVLHDDTVDRTSDGTGQIDRMTWEQAQKLDFAAKHILKDQYSPQRLPSVDEFVQECINLKLKMIIDLKTYDEVEKTTAYITGLFKKFPGLYSKALVSSFWPHLIYAIRAKDPKIVCSMAWRPYFLSYQDFNGSLKDSRPRFDAFWKHYAFFAADFALEWGLNNFLYYFLGLSAVLMQKDVLTPAYVQHWRSNGIRVIAWTVNNSLQKAYIENYLRVTLMSDSMDVIPVDEYLRTSISTDDLGE